MKNYYHLTKKELSFFSFIEEPIVSSDGLRRLSRPVVLAFCGSVLVHVWSLSWFKSRLRRCPETLSCFRFEIRSIY